MTHNRSLANHCNLEFEITENALIGRRINPSFPNDSKRWPEIVSIPISKHYYYEKAKDENGRDRNAFIENEARSHWSARPFMKLELSHMKIHDWAYAIPAAGEAQILSVDEIEWDQKNNFLGFTVITNDSAYGSENQGRYRINFSEFKHNPSFKKTPFNDKNYGLINVLHIVGEKADGIYQILHAAHWDVTKTHDIYLNNFPPEYVGVVEDILGDWNKALVSAGALTQSDVDSGKVGFRVNKTKLKHSFDLRHSSITWVSDMKISTAPSSPLGIALTQADVRNGEIVWSGITVYGGILEYYVKAFAGTAATTELSAKSSFQLSNIAKSLFAKMTSLQSPNLPSGMDLSGAGLANLQNYSKDYIDSRIDAKLKPSKSDAGIANLDFSSRVQIALQKKSNENVDFLKAANREESFQDYIVGKLFSIRNSLPSKEEKLEKNSSGATKRSQELSSVQIQNISNVGMNCADRSFADVAPGWIQGLGGKKGEYRDVLRSLVKELITHEFGHAVGLGHQFKENILPERGTVPEAIYQSHAKKATHEEGFTQFTSVMGYRHPRSEMRSSYDEVKPGPHDRLVLAYLYTQKYSTYKTGDVDFTFVDIPKEGVIPPVDPNGVGPKTSYFPQCNDLTASFSLDPYCNRFDRGHNATEIVENYFSDVSDNLEQSHFAFTDTKGANPEENENRLWKRNLSTMGRIRMFYDYMRKEYRDEIDSISQDESALYEFSSACKTGKSRNQKLLKMFNAKPKLKELCKVNANVVDQIRNLVTKNLSEYTKMDQSSAYVMTRKCRDPRDEHSQVGNCPIYFKSDICIELKGRFRTRRNGHSWNSFTGQKEA